MIWWGLGIVVVIGLLLVLVAHVIIFLTEYSKKFAGRPGVLDQKEIARLLVVIPEKTSTGSWVLIERANGFLLVKSKRDIMTLKQWIGQMCLCGPPLAGDEVGYTHIDLVREKVTVESFQNS